VTYLDASVDNNDSISDGNFIFTQHQFLRTIIGTDLSFPRKRECFQVDGNISAQAQTSFPRRRESSVRKIY
jgi:hypothetical protein